MNKRLPIYIFGGLILCAVIIMLILWLRPPKSVAEQPGIPITAEALFQAYNIDEKAANKLYLGKALEVTGTVANTDINQDGQLVVFLDSGDPLGSIVCTFPESPGDIPIHKQITVKGFCAGMLADVMLTDCVYIPAP